jgi:predicted ATPase
MHLRSAHIQHYKSLDEVTVEFATPITVIVGPNGAGKSNFVDCLRFVRDAVVDGLDRAVQRRQGISRIREAVAGDMPHHISVRLEFLQDLLDLPPMAARHAFTLKSLADGNYVVANEEALWNIASTSLEEILNPGASTSPVIPRQLGFTRDSSGAILLTHDFDFDSSGLRAPRTDRLALALVTPEDELGTSLANFESDWMFWSLAPDALRKESFEQAGTRLNEDGSNWASVVQALARSPEGASALEQINECLRVILPTYRDIKVSRVGSRLIPLFNFEDGHTTRSFDADQVSDGTLQAFGILLALYLQPPASLMVIEEPEQSMHPGALAVLVEAMREVSELTQIIVTTHSPQLIDHFKPEEIRVATMQDGRTRITPIAKTQIKAVKQRLMSLADFMQAEGLQPDLEP